jgi:hypothetical protein
MPARFRFFGTFILVQSIALPRLATLCFRLSTVKYRLCAVHSTDYRYSIFMDSPFPSAASFLFCQAFLCIDDTLPHTLRTHTVRTRRTRAYTQGNVLCFLHLKYRAFHFFSSQVPNVVSFLGHRIYNLCKLSFIMFGFVKLLSCYLFSFGCLWQSGLSTPIPFIFSLAAFV